MCNIRIWVGIASGRLGGSRFQPQVMVGANGLASSDGININQNL